MGWVVLIGEGVSTIGNCVMSYCLWLEFRIFGTFQVGLLCQDSRDNFHFSWVKYCFSLNNYNIVTAII